MSNEFLRDRRVALEEAFFARENEVLLQRLRDIGAATLKKEAFWAASGITDNRIIERLSNVNIGIDTFAALAFVPLVMVAWADGAIDDRERAIIRGKAEEMGLSKQDASYQLFEGWLIARPAAELLAAWKDYIAALAATLDGEARRSLKADVMTRAREVAAAAGGFLNVGRTISVTEKDVLSDIGAAFES